MTEALRPPPPDQTLVWACLAPGHTEVRWDGDTARCAHLGCPLTSELTGAFAELVRAAERRRVAVDVEVSRRDAAAAAYRAAAATVLRAAESGPSSGPQWPAGAAGVADELAAALLRRATDVEQGQS